MSIADDCNKKLTKAVVMAMKSSHILHVGYVGTLNAILLVLLAYNTDFDLQ